MGDNAFKISDEAKEQLYAEFAKRFAQEQADKKARAPLPVKITTELDNVSERQREERFQRFRSDCKKYALDEWITPQRINSGLYKDISKHKTITTDVISRIHELTETTQFQAKVAVEIFKQISYSLQHSASLEEASTIVQRAKEQSERLAIFGLTQAKNQENIARNYALDVPASIRHQVPKKDDECF